jgi:hypothetical protein
VPAKLEVEPLPSREIVKTINNLIDNEAQHSPSPSRESWGEGASGAACGLSIIANQDKYCAMVQYLVY